MRRWLANHGIGEMRGGSYHFPRYTEGCWGKPGRTLCWLCKFRYLAALFRLFRRTRNVEDHD